MIEFGTVTLPELRDDLEVIEGARTANGAPSWTLHDPVTQRFFSLGKIQFELLRHWSPGDPEQLAQQVNSHSSVRVSLEDVLMLNAFFTQHQLIKATSGREIYQKVRQSKQQFGQWLLKNYLFIRIPLVKPNRFLASTYPLVKGLYSQAIAVLLGVMFLLSMWLTIRQWDSFIAYLPDLFTWSGILGFGIALMFSKFIHELGHAYTAKRYGVDVPAMGLAFMVMWPLLYTDTTNSWRLKSRRQRFHISAGGIVAELGLAVVALLLWNLLPDGPARTGLFFLASATWITTLVINLNPFMRWDGYYLLADAWGIDNLQHRAFALARWWMREKLFGIGDEVPEQFAPGRQRWLITYAFSTWLYRLILFLGIALLVYYFFFKLLGLFLMLVELAWFIGNPIYKEIKQWFSMREKIHWNRYSLRSLLLLAVLIGVLFIPWHSRVSAPAVLAPLSSQGIYSPQPAQIKRIAVEHGQWVNQGDVLFELSSPDIDFALTQAQGRVAAVQTKLQSEKTQGSLQQSQMRLLQQLREAEAGYQGHLKEQQRLQIRAPFSGRVVDLLSELHQGQWVSETHRLALLVDDRQHQLEALVSEVDLHLIQAGSQASYYSSEVDKPKIDFEIHEIDPTGMTVLAELMLSSENGGPIAVRLDKDQRHIMESAYYRVLLTAQQDISVPHKEMGYVYLEGEAESFVQAAIRIVSAVLIRESGF